ncbi:MAG: ComEC/Rec2 family competence protein [Acidimicrobiia bacterium]|nr:ComEC/Rec2 family competence protein [Acidimicrobiia bacterium]
MSGFQDTPRPDGATAERKGERHLADWQVLALSALVWAGARLAVPVPLTVGAALAAAGLAARRPSLVLAAALVCGSARGAASEAAYRPVEGGSLAATVALITDPAPSGAGWHAELRLADGRRVDAWAYGSAGVSLSRLAAGDQAPVSGRLTPLDGGGWARARHLVGRLSVAELGPPRHPGGPRALVEWARRAVVAGAELVPEAQRPLYLGLVIGDDRWQPAGQRARFRAAGLSHLLAVSGQNVAFLLAVARPLLLLTGRRSRFALTVALLAGFAAATRAEPSVLRATATAGLAAWAATTGRPQSGRRLLALAVAGLVLVDPFLVQSVGFQLSVAASAGILLLGPTLAARLPGPVPMAEALAVTLAAQLAVAPLLVGRFGPVSLASVPANLLAGWAAGAVMTWGLSVGVVAGVLPHPAGVAVQTPAAGLVWWLDAVAGWATRLPLPLLDARPGAALVVLVAVAAGARSGAKRGAGHRIPARGAIAAARATAAVALGAAVAVGAAAVPHPPHRPTTLAGDGWWVPGGHGCPSVLVLGPDAGDDLLDALLAHRIGRIDVVVATRGGARAAEAVVGVGNVGTMGLVLAPPRHRIRGAKTVGQPFGLATAAGLLTVAPDGNRLTVTGGR